MCHREERALTRVSRGGYRLILHTGEEIAVTRVGLGGDIPARDPARQTGCAWDQAQQRERAQLGCNEGPDREVSETSDRVIRSSGMPAPQLEVNECDTRSSYIAAGVSQLREQAIRYGMQDPTMHQEAKP